MKILAIDASTKSSGFAVFYDKELIYSCCKVSNSQDLIIRIEKMADYVQQIIAMYPDIEKIILEEVLPEGSKGNIKTHKALMWLQAAIAIRVHNIYPHVKIEYIYPSEWRAAVGVKTGRGIKRTELKEKDINLVQEKFGLKVNDDHADAILIGYGYYLLNKNKINFK